MSFHRPLPASTSQCQQSSWVVDLGCAGGGVHLLRTGKHGADVDSLVEQLVASPADISEVRPPTQSYMGKVASQVLPVCLLLSMLVIAIAY